MSVDRSMRNVLAALLLIAALFLAMNRVVASAPAVDWWLPLVLFILGAALVFAPRLEFRRAQPDEDEDQVLASGVQVYSVTAQHAPRLHTMTIRPDPEAAEYTMTVTPAPSGEDEPLPFSETRASLPAGELSPGTPSASVEMVTPVSPETPTPALEPEPETEPTPMSPETPTPDAPPEPTVMSPETPTPDESVTASQHTAPEKEVVAEKTSAPQQPYEAAQIGTITPEQVDRVMDDNTDNAHDQNVPAVTEAASPRVTAQERDGEGVVGTADDLTKLNGIGRKSAAALKSAGIDSFQKLANSSDETIRAALASGGVRLVGDVNTWAHQAAYAARGDWEGLNRFIAGRGAANGD